MSLKNFKIGQKMFFGFGVVTLIMLSVLGNLFINFTRESKAVDNNIHTYNIIREANGILISLVSIETGVRGFAITGKDEFLEPYYNGITDYKRHYELIKSLTSDNGIQQQRLDSFNRNFEAWLDWEETKLIEGRKKVISGESKMEDLIELISLAKGKKDMDNLRSIIGEIIRDEQNHLDERKKILEQMESQTRIVMVLGGCVATILIFIISFLIVRMVVRPVGVVTETFKRISEDDNVNLDVRLNTNSNDELGEMAKYFNKFVSKLKDIIEENKNQSWIKTGQAELGVRVGGEKEIAELSSNIITFIAKYINAQIGAIYVKSAGEDVFKLLGSYAYNRRKNLSNEIRSGEGIVGQSILEKQTIVISNVPEDYIKIESGVGEGIPRNILVSPCIYNNEVIAIIEIGTFSEFTDIQMKFIEQISSSIAISIHSCESRSKMKELLNKTLQQTEELQAQQEELRQNNEELEEQTRALKESETHLQSQQEELRVINEELEERTKNLELQKNEIFLKNESLKSAQSEIEQKAKALEAASKYKSEFLANMSHELRTPLNSILVLSDMLATNKDSVMLNNKQIEFAKTINSSGKDLLRLINDILDLSKVEAGKLDVTFEEINLSEFVKNLESLFKPVAEQKGLYFKTLIDEGVPSNITSDIHRIQQIVNNLLSNAFKFTHEGGITLTVKRPKNTEVFEQKGTLKNTIAIEINDTGIGIPFEKQKLIFEAFKQADGTTSRKYGGTGLGLYITRELAHLLGGEIYLKSEEGKGSTFTLVISDDIKEEQPIQVSLERGKDIEGKIDVARENEKNSVEKDSNVISNAVGNTPFDKSLLIIEDDRNFSNVLSELAGEKGYRCIVAQDGKSGLKLAKQYKPDAVLLDIGLPDMNGWKVVQRLKEDDVTKDIPVHIISGEELQEQFEKHDGIIGYLCKPVSLANLNDVFEKIQSKVSKPLKKLLIVDESKEHIKDISGILRNKDVEIISVDSGLEAHRRLTNESFDCLILDLKLKDMSGLKFLEELHEKDLINLPIIIHTEETLTQDGELELQKYAKSIIIKGMSSTERLIAEASLFLHNVDSKIEEKKINVIKTSLEKEDQLKNKKVLIVDDDMRNVFALSSALEEKGLKIVVGRNGKEGIQKLNQNPDVDLILMDIMMPEMDGYTAIREIRKSEKLNKVPIIAVTAKAMKEDKEKCIEAGADDYLTKPIDMNKLISLLRVWLYR